MDKLTKPTPIEKEIKLDPSRVIMSKTDPKGIIEYANKYFMEISGYEEFELMGQPHNIIRHPDMPKVIFKLLWERLQEGKNAHIIIKNLTKNGSYYWVLTNFETKYNEVGQIVSYFAHRKAAPSSAIFEIEKLYKTILSIEKKRSPEIAEKYFYSLIEESGKTYDDYILSLLNITPSALKAYFSGAVPKQQETPKAITKKKSIFKKLFAK